MEASSLSSSSLPNIALADSLVRAIGRCALKRALKPGGVRRGAVIQYMPAPFRPTISLPRSSELSSWKNRNITAILRQYARSEVGYESPNPTCRDVIRPEERSRSGWACYPTALVWASTTSSTHTSFAHLQGSPAPHDRVPTMAAIAAPCAALLRAPATSTSNRVHSRAARVVALRPCVARPVALGRGRSTVVR
jgi:hypothetical protein